MQEKKINTTGEVYANPKYKDTVFRMLFKEKSALLSLYNAVNDTNYDDPGMLEIATLENAIYMNMKNDVSFILETSLSLYEHQSTFNPNMPLRNLFYICRQYEKLIDMERIYSTRLILLPTPKFVVFYNGTDNRPDKTVLRLSDSYQVPTAEAELELTITMLNINAGHNQKLMKKCQELYGYSIFVEKIRHHRNAKLPLSEAVEKSVQECLNEGILKEFLLENRKEVIQMSIFEYDEEAHKKLIHQEGYEDGYDAGLKEGHDTGLKEGLENGIRVLIDLLNNASQEEIIAKIIQYYSVSREDAELYFTKYAVHDT